jgi:AraC family transcriptional regulator
LNKQDENIIRINHVKKYIDENIVQKLPLSELAEKACFSPFHFQRVFKAVVGETPKQYIKRLRLEATAQYLFLKPGASILEVGINYGFSSLEDFSRAFKNHYTISPEAFRNRTEEQKISILNKKTGQQLIEGVSMHKFLSVVSNYNTENLEIEVIKCLPKKIIYRYHTLKEFKTIMESFQKLESWGRTRELIDSNSEIFGLMFDFPAFTSHNNNRFCTCVSVNKKPEVTGDINYMELPSRTYASFRIRTGKNEYMKSVSVFVKKWLPTSGYEICQLPIIILPFEDPLKNNLLEMDYQLCIPIIPK